MKICSTLMAVAVLATAPFAAAYANNRAERVEDSAQRVDTTYDAQHARAHENPTYRSRYYNDDMRAEKYDRDRHHSHR